MIGTHKLSSKRRERLDKMADAYVQARGELGSDTDPRVIAKMALKTMGYGAGTVSKMVTEMMKDPYIKERIDAYSALDAPKTAQDVFRLDGEETAPPWLLGTLREWADADLRDLYYLDGPSEGRIKPPHLWPAIWRRGLVRTIEYTAAGLVSRVTTVDRLKILEMIGNHRDVKAFNHNIELTGAGGGPITLLTRQIIQPDGTVIDITPNAKEKPPRNNEAA